MAWVGATRVARAKEGIRVSMVGLDDEELD